MGTLKDTAVKTAIGIASVAGAAAGAAGLSPSVNDVNRPVGLPTKEERTLASIQKRENENRIKDAKKNR
jgi:hypothetical protein